MLIPADSTFDADRDSFLTTSAVAAEHAAETYAGGAFIGEANDLSGLSLAYAERVLQNEPKDPFGIGRFYKAKALAHRGDFAGASRTIAEVIQLRSRDPVVLHTFARIQSRAGMPRESYESLRAALAAGYTVIQFTRKCRDFQPARALNPAIFDDLLTLKCAWRPVWTTYPNDVILVNRSAFALTNITFRVDVRRGSDWTNHMSEGLLRLNPGEVKTWKGIMKPGSGADGVIAKLTCDTAADITVDSDEGLPTQ